MNVLADKIIIFRDLGAVFKNCGGVTAGQTQQLAADQAFQKMMTSDYQTTFGQDQQLFNNLTTGLSQITAAGPGQQGYTAPELASLNSQNINAAAASNSKLQTAIGENAATKGTADPGVESGVVQAERAAAATNVDTAMNNRAAEITQQDYATGRQNYWDATKGLESAPGAFQDPASQFANATSNSYKNTGSQADANQQASQEGIDSTLGLITGLASSGATAFAGA